MATQQRESRFNAPSAVENSVLEGYGSAVRDDPVNKGLVRRNLRDYKSLRKFAKPGQLSRLRGKTDAQLEKMAVRAVIRKNDVQKRKLRTNVNRKQYGKPLLQRAQKKLNQGYDIRRLGQQGADVKDIANPRLRRATKHLSNIQRNRKIMSTKIMAGRGYDIRMGHEAGPTAKAKYQTGLRKMPSPTATLKTGRKKPGGKTK